MAQASWEHLPTRDCFKIVLSLKFYGSYKINDDTSFLYFAAGKCQFFSLKENLSQYFLLLYLKIAYKSNFPVLIAVMLK